MCLPSRTQVKTVLAGTARLADEWPADVGGGAGVELVAVRDEPVGAPAGQPAQDAEVGLGVARPLVIHQAQVPAHNTASLDLHI